MTPRRLTETQVQNLHAEIQRSTIRSMKRANEMVRRGRLDARDGYPSSSGGGSGGGSDVSKPTEAEALAPNMADPTLALIERWEAELRKALDATNLMDNLSAQVLAIEADERGRQQSIPDCVNPACGVTLFDQGPTGRGTAGRCDACYEFRRTHNGDDRPRQLVERQRERQASA